MTYRSYNIQRLEPRRLLASGADAAPAPLSTPVTPARYVENLNRGIVAVRNATSNVYVGWRLLGTDDPSIAFNVYRSYGTAAPVKRNATPITSSTNFVDTGVAFTTTVNYFVRPVINNVEQVASETFSLVANTPIRQYLNVPLQIPAGGTTPASENYSYNANDASVGDLDGDGDYEIVLKWDPSNSKDNSQSGYTGNVYVDAYTLEGTRLWRIDLGRNIRAGAHYTQFIVYDLDSDGKAEVAMKTAPGTIDGVGNNVLMNSDDPNADYRNTSGYILSGPEYLTVFDGQTGSARNTVAFEPARGAVTQWGDSYGNRVDRFTAAVAYLDGEHPSLIMGRGYYGPQSSSGQSRNEIAAYDFSNNKLTLRWHFKAGYNINSNINGTYVGQGPHGMSIADVDADGKDEIVYGACVIDDTGTGLYSTGLGHGDAFHVSDLDPSRPGLEVFMVHESPSAYQSNGRNAGGEFRDARTGELIFGIPATNDVGRGVAADIDPNSPGAEMWGLTVDADPLVTRKIWAANGTALYDMPGNMFTNFVVWWDADFTRELLDGTTISEWNNPGRSNFDLDPATSGQQSAPNAASNNGTKSTPALSADLFGDWREEVIWRRSDNTALEIFTTGIVASSRMYTLMHDTQYRVAIAWQNGAYNQPPHPSFFLGANMAPPPTPNIRLAGVATPRTDIYQAETAVLSGGTFIETTNAGFNSSGYANSPTTGGSIAWSMIDGGGGGPSVIQLRYALGATAPRTARLIVNGVASDITFTPTGSFNAWSPLSLTVNLNPGRNNAITIQTTGQDAGNIDELRILPSTDVVRPALISNSFDPDTSSLSLVFSEDVGTSLSASDFTLSGPNGLVTPTAVTFDLATSTAILALPFLTTGSYTLGAFAVNIADHAGNTLAGPLSLSFNFLQGDATRDGTVGFDDLLLLAQNYGKSAAALWTEGDFNYDGRIDFDDLLLLAQSYGTSSIQSAPTPTRSTRRNTIQI